MEIVKEKGILTLKREVYAKKILENNMNNSKAVDTPVVKGEKLDKISGNGKYPYREIVGNLLYLTTKTRPDIAYAVNMCSRDLNNYTNQRVNDTERIFRYLNGSKDQGIAYRGTEDKNELVAYCDSDFAGDEQTRKSTTGYVILFCGGPITWSSRKQSVVVLSSTEAEYIAATECCKDLLYLNSLIKELKGKNVKLILNVRDNRR